MILLIIVIVPVLLGGLMFLLPKNAGKLKGALLIGGFAVNLALNLAVVGRNIAFTQMWLKSASFSLRLYSFSSFILICAAALSLLAAIYAVYFSKNNNYNITLFYAGMLLTVAMTNGAVLAANLMLMLFFWQAVMGTLFMMIAAGGKNSYKTAVKAVVITGVTDLCMMFGIALTSHLAGTLDMNGLNLQFNSWGIAAFILLAVGAVSKAGAMPFHTWIPDAADNAPTPFMAFMPGSVQKLLGVYLLSRLALDIFKLAPGSAMSFVLMAMGILTIICAVIMAVIQTDYKHMLSYLSISQAGYIIAAIGTAVPADITGVPLYTLINSICISGLFYISSAVEKRGGLGKKKPAAFVCVIFAAALMMVSIFILIMMIGFMTTSGAVIFYIFAAVGVIFTAVLLIKFGSALFLGKETEIADRYRKAPVLRQIYALAEKRYFDPYVVAGYAVNGFSWVSLKINDAISWFYDVFAPRFVGAFTYVVKKAHNGSPARYIIWILGGVVIILAAYALL